MEEYLRAKRKDDFKRDLPWLVCGLVLASGVPFFAIAFMGMLVDAG